MRIRGSQIVAGIMLLVGGLVLVALFSVDTPTRAAVSEPPPVGALPPVDQPDQVAVIEVETQALHLGTIANSRVAEGSLKVRNRGKAPLQITEIKTSCGCTQGKIAPERATISAGGEASIDVYVDPKRIPGFHSKKTLTIFSNDPKTPTLAVEVEANVEPEFEMPERIEFGDIPKGEAKSLTIPIRQVGNEVLEIKSAQSFVPEGQPAPAGISYAVTKLPEGEWKTPGKVEYALTVTLDASVPPGAFRHTCLLKTNLARLPMYRCTVVGNIVSFYRISPPVPERVMLRPKDGVGLETGTATIAADKPLEITNLMFDATKLTAVVRPGENPNTVHIDITATETAPRGRLDEEITFVVKSGGEQFNDRVAARAYITRVAPPPAS
jgi:hypothetical protein